MKGHAEPRRGRRARKVIDRRPRFQGWRTTDEEEIERRRQRAVTEPIAIEALEAGQPLFGTFRVASEGGGAYEVEIRSLEARDNSCGCPDHQVNGLGTCKHVEAVLAQLLGSPGRGVKAAVREGSVRCEVFLRRSGERPEVRVQWPPREPRRSAPRALLAPFFAEDGALAGDPLASLPALAREVAAAPHRVRERIRLSRHLLLWVEQERHRVSRGAAREHFLAEVRTGRQSLDVLRHPLYPYQQEGMLHLAFGERALLADEMGLGKTIQAIAACELLRRTRGVERVLVICPASLKAEWEEQIAKFTDLPVRVVQGPRVQRLRQYGGQDGEGPFFYLTNYEQVLSDGEEIQRRLAPDVVILDEAQRIKNWQARTAEAVKRLASPYAFVLTGTPLENRIDEIYSLVQFLDPGLLGPLFRFNRLFYELDERGRPAGYKNLRELHRRLKSVLLRRRKDEVEDQLPERTLNNYFVDLEPEQAARYEEYSTRVARLLDQAKRRPLSPEEFDRLQQWLACMRMLCDTPYILDSDCRACPKLAELEEILAELLAQDGHPKVLIFSEWERMLELVRELAQEMGVGFAWHTGSVPQSRRRQEIRRFKDDPDCRLFLSTDSGGVGLNLQAASVVINLDLPWNPARLEQRIARAWRKHQLLPVQVVNLIAADTIEHRMLGLLAAKQALADGVLDGRGELAAMPLPSGRAALVERLEALLAPASAPAVAPAPPLAGEGPEQLGRELVNRFDRRLLLLETASGPDGRETLLAVLDRPAGEERAEIAALVEKRCGGSSPAPALEILDRESFAAVERLIAAGVLKFAASDRRQIHRSPALGQEAGNVDPRRLARARELLAQAERKVRMAAVLAGGGFPVEALPVLREGVEAGLRSLAHLHLPEVPEPEELSLDGLVERLPREAAGAGAVALAALVALAGRLRGGPEALLGVGEEEARGWIEEGEALVRRIGPAASLHG